MGSLSEHIIVEMASEEASPSGFTMGMEELALSEDCLGLPVLMLFMIMYMYYSCI